MLKSSAEREQLLQQLTQRGGQKKSEQPPFGKKFTGRKISSRVKEAALGFETRETTDVFSFLEQSIFLHRLLTLYIFKKLLSLFVCLHGDDFKIAAKDRLLFSDSCYSSSAVVVVVYVYITGRIRHHEYRKSRRRSAHTQH